MHCTLLQAARRSRTILATLLLAGALSLPCAGPAHAEQDPRVLQLKHLILDIQNNSTLAITNMTLCSKIEGFASYEPLPTTVIPPDGKFLVYYEPLNWFTRQADGRYEISVVQDMRIKLGEEVIYFRENLYTHALTSQHPVLDFFAMNTLDLHALPPGEYTYEVIFKDLLKKQEVTASTPFQIVKPAGQ
ncbi:hypothetical protein [Megalodesulfovibrio gigas]|uniref:Uncharacterized protein n=1 Tax=Megalodesulfovibrio gigas (strain ATCC 19364 / DSM 1382 / NCIMB 9332 / VKM B-1759) TaxID=1121448 RepID=T2GAQ6_MEGG1|nr:hypothetical protein [Megalodesulfovibrio gigas]AGW13373.1 hypothetical protein DGI_1533 [Megalodesulfovibrio gigas DSM 1382 = ATCC 19364]